MIELSDWLRRLNTDLSTDVPEEMTDAILDLARAAAHGIARPAAPLSAFVVGYAAGRASRDGFDAAHASELARRAGALAEDAGA